MLALQPHSLTDDELLRMASMEILSESLPRNWQVEILRRFEKLLDEREHREEINADK